MFPVRDDPATARQVRKQLLQARASVERAEMMAAVDAASQSSASLRHRIPGFALSKSLPLALRLVQGFRMIKPLASAALPLALAAARRPVLRYSLIGGASALLIWKGWKLLAEQRREKAEEEAEDRDDSPNTTRTPDSPV